MKSVALHNLGCKVNSYEIEVMQQMLQEKGYTIVPFDEIADIYIVNTCTVTNIADRKSRQMLHCPHVLWTQGSESRPWGPDFRGWRRSTDIFGADRYVFYEFLSKY